MLDSFSRPWVLVVAAEASNATDALWAIQRSGRVRVTFVRGSKMKAVQDLFDEFAAAFQFPYYFGENWAAFDECMADLSWLEDSARAVVVLDSDVVLPDDRDFEVLMRLLDRVADEWSRATEFRAAWPFHVVLHVNPANTAVLIDRLRRVGVAHAPFDPSSA